MRTLPAAPSASIATLVMSLAFGTTLQARSPACTMVMASYDALEQASDWQCTTRAGDGEALRSRKVAGRHQYQLPGGDAWMDLPATAITAGRAMVEDMRADDGSVTGCEITGTDTIEGTGVTTVRAHIAPRAVPAYDATFHIGADGLPYRMVSDDVQVDYRYGKGD